MRAALVLGTCAVLLGAPLSAQAAGDSLRGELRERVVARSDTTQRYALYLPRGYSRARRWPILFLMDPRGRALVPLRLFRAPADRHGYILVSSYNTLSDGPSEPNLKAMNAMLEEAQRDLAIDVRRFYLAGFSGTARVAWEFGYELAGHVAGIIGAGGGQPIYTIPQPRRTGPATFVFFGAVGTTDFNYEEMVALDRRLAASGQVHYTAYFDGPHRWPPDTVCARALDWMEIVAMRAGLREKDPSLIDSLYSRWLTDARAQEAANRLVEARASYTALVRDFSPLRDVGAAEAARAQLEKGKAIRDAERRRAQLAARDSSYWLTMRTFFHKLGSGSPPPLDRALAELEVRELERDAKATDDAASAEAAQRLLEKLFVFTSFYEPRAYFRNGDSRRALAVLQIAHAIRPTDAQTCYQLARGQALTGHARAALTSLECAVAAGVLSAATIEADSAFRSLRTDSTFRAVLERAKQ